MKRIPCIILLFACNTPFQEEDVDLGIETQSMYGQGDQEEEESSFEEYDVASYEEDGNVQEDMGERLYFFEEIDTLEMQSSLMETLLAERVQIYSLASFPDRAIFAEHDISVLEEGATSMYEEEIIDHLFTASDDYDIFYLPLRASRIQEPLWDIIATVGQDGLLCYDVEGMLLSP